ncbi:MAG: DUF3300 domain-containing protein [Opitutaceae bacterium]|jgi:hypothetical protein|nr:DUF3300 domain-containing protein [Opitutaceae bacterium]
MFFLFSGLAFAGVFRAQQETLAFPLAGAASAPAATAAMLDDEELDKLLGPVALYPDPLLALILPAATESSDVVLAARWLAAGGDVEKIDEQPWDESVRALARYPEVVKWMDENLAWTQQLGAAFLAQPADVMKAVQRLRVRAKEAGNLTDTPEQNVVVEKDYIRIVPAEPEIIYVPRYDPLVVYYPSTVTYYYGPPVIFGPPYRSGAWLRYDCNWLGFNIWIGSWGPVYYRRPAWGHRPPPHYGSGHRPPPPAHVWHPRPGRRPPPSRFDRGGVTRPEPMPGVTPGRPDRPSTPGVRPRPSNPSRDRQDSLQQQSRPPQPGHDEGVRPRPPRQDSGERSGRNPAPNLTTPPPQPGSALQPGSPPPRMSPRPGRSGPPPAMGDMPSARTRVPPPRGPEYSVDPGRRSGTRPPEAGNREERRMRPPPERMQPPSSGQNFRSSQPRVSPRPPPPQPPAVQVQPAQPRQANEGRPPPPQRQQQQQRQQERQR